MRERALLIPVFLFLDMTFIKTLYNGHCTRGESTSFFWEKGGFYYGMETHRPNYKQANQEGAEGKMVIEIETRDC